MELSDERLVRFYSEVKHPELFSWEGRSESSGKSLSCEYEFSPSFLGGNGRSRIAESFRFGKSEVLPEEDNVPLQKKIFDPGSNIFLKWNQVFMVSCLVAVFVDPLYFYLPKIGKHDMSWCIKTDLRLRIVVTLLRTCTDLFYLVHVIIKFRTAYITPGSGVFGKGELVRDRKKIAQKYLRSDFLIDLIAMLPLPQIVILFIIPATRHQRANHNNNSLALIVLIQYIPRLYLLFQLSGQIVESTGVITMAWAGAAYNLLLYIMASHFLGAAWYLFSVDRYTSCWKSVCKNEHGPLKCLLQFLDCDNVDFDGRIRWAEHTNVFNGCDPNRETSFKYGIFENAVTKNVVSSSFAEKYFYCLWWGLQNLSSYGQNLTTSIFMGETAFAALIAILGLVLSAHLIGNMQTYLKSLTVRREEWRLKNRDTEEWMRHRQLPEDLRQRVRRSLQYKWVATRGVDEKAILIGLPADSRRDIQRHLCLDLVRRVPFFSQMDDQLLDAICEHLVSSLSTEGTYIVREGEHVTEMLFILRGKLESSTTNGNQIGFFNSIMLRPGDFCGEELLAWALLPISTVNLPTSTRSVKALSEVEAFVLQADDLKFVANQFRRLHSKKLQHTFRLCSHHWRSWSAFFIQAAWRRYKRKSMTKALISMESYGFSDGNNMVDEQERHHFPASLNPSSVTLLASRFARGTQSLKDIGLSLLRKPEEPDFSSG